MLRAASRIGAGGALAGTGWYFYSQYQLQNEPVPDFAKQGLRVLELTPFESNPAFFDQAQPVSAVTFFEGKPPTGFLAQRVAEIVRANPWLAARHVRIKGTHAFTYDDGTAVYPECFAVAGADAGLHRGLTFRQTLATLDALAKEEKGLGLLPAQGAQPPGSPQFRVTLVPDSKAPNERFALVTTMSHILGDGHTFYAIHNQLSKRAKPAPLSPARKLDALAQIKERLGGEGGMHAGGMFESPAFLVNYLVQLMIRLPLAARGVLSPIPGPEFDSFVVSPAWVAAQKKRAAAAGDVPYVSTNDCVTSAIMRAMDVGVVGMAVDLRGRVPAATAADAGNYEDVILYRERDYETPSLIRESLTNMKRAAQPPTALPSATDWLRLPDHTIGLVTNWVTSYGDDLVLPGCKQRLHLPMFECKPELGMGSITQMGVIFAPRKGETGLLLFAAPGCASRLRATDGGAIVGAPLVDM